MNAPDEHRYIIRAPWGDTAEADTHDAALTARRTLAQDGIENGESCRLEDVTIVDRGYEPLAA